MMNRLTSLTRGRGGTLAGGMVLAAALMASGCARGDDADVQTGTNLLGAEEQASSVETPETTDGERSEQVQPAAAPDFDPDAARAAAKAAGEAVEPVSCSNVDNIGVLDDGTVSRTIDTATLDHNYRIRCAPDDLPMSSEYLLEFQVMRRSLVNLEVKAHGRDAMIELRRGSCQTPEAITSCTDRETEGFIAEPGQAYVAVVQTTGRLEGQLDVEIDAEPTDADACKSGQPRICEGGEIALCSTTKGKIDRYSCPTECAGEHGCQGETCAAAIPVTEDQETIEGFTDAFRSDFDTQFVPGRPGGEAWQSVETPGSDLVLALEDLERGDVVTVDASGDRADHVIAIRTECSRAGSAVAGSDMTDSLSWRVPEDGTYFAVIDRTMVYPGPFEVEVTRN